MNVLAANSVAANSLATLGGPSTLQVPGGGAPARGPGGYGSAVVVGVVLIAAAAVVWAWRRRGKLDPRTRAFHRLARRLGLTSARREQVLALARAARVDAPATLLISTRAYQEAERAASMLEPKPGALREASKAAAASATVKTGPGAAAKATAEGGGRSGRTLGVG